MHYFRLGALHSGLKEKPFIYLFVFLKYFICKKNQKFTGFDFVVT